MMVILLLISSYTLGLVGYPTITQRFYLLLHSKFLTLSKPNFHWILLTEYFTILICTHFKIPLKIKPYKTFSSMVLIGLIFTNFNVSTVYSEGKENSRIPLVPL